jgi:hypothetical protein
VADAARLVLLFMTIAPLLALLLAQSAPASASPVLVEEEDPLLQFSFGWPAEAAAVPALDARFRARLAERRGDAVARAEESRADGAQGGYAFHGHFYSERWGLAGAAAGLLSLAARIESYTGGAHGNVAFDGLIWDSARDAAIEPAALFASPGGLSAITDRYCAELDRQREERRGEPVTRSADSDDFMTACPAIGEQTIVPADTDRNGRMDMIGILIAPYAAGPWAEGPYHVELPLTAADVAAIAPTYRDAFEPQQ